MNQDSYVCLDIVVFFGSVRISTPPRPARLGERLARFCTEELISRGHQVNLVSTGAVASILWVALVTAPFASAQWRTAQDAEICITGTGSRSLDIAVCGRALGRTGLSELDRASVLTARGKAYGGSGELAAALTDFDAALMLNPVSASTFNQRALVLEASGHQQRALKDFRSALALSPRFAAAYKNRGIAQFFAGDLACAAVDLDAALALAGDDAESYVFRGFLHYLAGRHRDAADDFQRVHALNLPYPYLSLWRYLAGAGSGAAGRGQLAEARAALSSGEWPQPLLDVYLGELYPERLIATLEDADRSPGRQRRLAASHYYLAALERLHGRRERALSHLAKAVALSKGRVPERALAEQELAAAGRTRN
jgi:lipoprotein NlpI